MMTTLEALPHVATRVAPIDAGIRELERLIDSGQYDLLSLDIFDTVVWRMVPAPTDVFFLVARMLERRGVMYPAATAESFVRERVNAEQRARKASASHEVTLDAIYAEFPQGYLKDIDGRAVTEIEFATEREVVKVDARMHALIDRAKAKGMKTAFVSDTYFTLDQIKRLVAIEVDYTLLSCERNVSKYMGLHRFLLSESHVAPHRILHVGDNLEADIHGPEVFGIQRYWLRKWPDAFTTLIHDELPDGYSARAPYLVSHDGGLTSLRSRAMSHCATDYSRWGAGILGPIVSGFADWVIERCCTLGITDVLCLMREGRLLKRVLETQDGTLRCHEFFISRFVALKAAIFEASEVELRAFLGRPERMQRGAILEQLGLTRDAVRGADPEEHLSLHASLELIGSIAHNRMLRKQVLRSSAEVRRRLLQHLAALVPEGEPRRLAVVDLGYSGTIQRCLHAICARERRAVTLHGLYLVTGGDVHDTQATGMAAEGWLAENGQPTAMAHTFMRSPEIVEQSLMADCGSTLGYADDGSPILGSPSIPEEQRAQINEVQHGVLHYATLWSDHRGRHDRIEGDRMRSLCQAICIRSVARPLDIELGMFGRWLHDANFGTDAARRLTAVRGLHEWQVSHMSAHQLASLSSGQVYWPFGVACGIGRTMGEAVANIFLRTVKPEVFESALDAREMIFYWDSGHGFRSAESSVERYTVNNRSRVWHRCRLEMRKGRNRMFGFRVGAPGEVLQLTGIILHIQPERGADEVVTAGHDEIDKQGYLHLHDNLYVVNADPPLLTVRTDRLDDFTGVVDVDICFALVARA